MAAKTFYVTNNVLDSVHQEMSETSPGSEATSSPNYGWSIPTSGTLPLYAKADAGAERASSSFAATPVEPDGSIDTSLGDCWRTTGKLTGTFATGNWTFQMRVIAVSGGGSQDGRAAFRLFRGPNADGSGATEITSGRLVGGTVTDLTTSTAQTSAHSSTSIGSFDLNDEYLFVQIGWEATGLGAHGSPDVIIRIGTSASLVTSTDFSPVVTGAAAITASATLSLVGSLILAGALALTGTGTLAAAGSLEHHAAAALTGTATLAAAGSVDRNGAAALPGVATLAAAGAVDRNGAAALSGVGTLAAAGTVEAGGAEVLGAASLTGTATLTAAVTTRFQLPRDGPAYDVQSPVDPALAAWDDTSETAYRPGRPWRMSPDRAPVSNGSGPECIQANIVGELETALILAWISDPCIAQTIGGAGWTLKGVVRAIMDFADCEHSRVTCSLKVVSLDGLTLRGTLLTLGFYGTEGPYAISPSDPQNRFIANGAALAQVDLLGGDRIMLELGSSPTNAPLLSDFVCFYVGDSAGTDLAENETATDARDPWIQISKEIIFSPTHTGAAALSGSATLMASGSVERAGAAALSASATLAAAGSVDRGGAAVLAGVATLAAAGTVETTTPRAGSDVHLVNELGDVHLAQELGDVQLEDRVGDVLITEPLGDVIRVDLLDRDAARPDPI